MIKYFILLTFAFLTACTAQHFPAKPKSFPTPEKPRPPKPASVSAETYLRKLSLHIRGVTPSREEYASLKQAVTPADKKAFFSATIERYLSSSLHVGKMNLRLEELFQLKVSNVPADHPYLTVPVEEFESEVVRRYASSNSLNKLFRDIAFNDLSWDTLLTGKTYTAFPRMSNFSESVTIRDGLFYSLAGGTDPNHVDPIDVKFADDDVRVAGALTTSRFYNRYVNTALNKNRRRAAAVFRIFLCDDMKAVVVDEKGKQDEIIDLVYPDAGAGAIGHFAVPPADRHGTDPACMKCHYKLDPMGSSFQNSGLVLSKFASPGALVYTRASGEKVNVPTKGLGELAHAITEQPEYIDCQLRHFWRWFVGEDQPLDEKTLAELREKFESVQRRPNRFIAYLVTRPEFGGADPQSEIEEMVFGVKSVLKNCNGCHMVEGIPSFTDWPIGGASSNKKFLLKIQMALGLDGSGIRRMPPKSSVWQPQAEELELLQKWFDLGAPNARGERQLDEN